MYTNASVDCSMNGFPISNEWLSISPNFTVAGVVFAYAIFYVIFFGKCKIKYKKIETQTNERALEDIEDKWVRIRGKRENCMEISWTWFFVPKQNRNGYQFLVVAIVMAI